MSTWTLTMFLVHLAAFVGFGALLRNAPCWMQKVAVAIFIGAELLISLSYALALNQVSGSEHLLRLGFAVEHLAVLLWVARVLIFPNGAPKWNSFSARSPNS